MNLAFVLLPLLLQGPPERGPRHVPTEAELLAETPLPPEDQTPSAANLDAWGTFIRPSAKELAFEGIGWRNAFWPAVEEARALGRPLLLWTMNGHPLGCT